MKLKFLSLVIGITLSTSSLATVFGGFDPNNPHAFDATFASIKQQAEQGDAKAQYALGTFYEHGKGTAVDYRQALHWYEESAGHGYDYAKYALALLYAHGLGVEENTSIAARWLINATESGDPVMLNMVGWQYEQGTAIPGDAPSAAAFYRAAASKGFVISAYHLGSLYERGLGVEPDLKQAVQWYVFAAKQGLLLAEKALANLYFSHRDQVVNLEEAIHWYRESAEDGDGPSLAMLGAIYSQGIGVKQNPVVAYAMFLLADQAMGSHVSAPFMAKKLTAAQVKDGQDLATQLHDDGLFQQLLDTALNPPPGANPEKPDMEAPGARGNP
jgi:hypothetical protein